MQTTDQEKTDQEKMVIPPGTLAIEVDAEVTLTTDGTGNDLSALDIKAGDLLFIVPVEGKYGHMEEGGRLVIEGELRWVMQDVSPRKQRK